MLRRHAEALLALLAAYESDGRLWQARRTDVLRMVLREGAILGAIGVSIGLPAALASGRLVSSQLYGVGALDPLTLVAAALGIGAVALAAGLPPAALATRVEPASVLRSE